MTVKFTSTTGYVVPDDLALAVNAAVALGRPLLVKGEPGTGKTMLAHAITESLDMPLIVLNVRAQDLNMNHNSGNGRVALIQNYIPYRFPNSFR